MVIVCTFLTSLCFSVVVEVIQTLFHIEHKDHVEHEEQFHVYTYETIIILGALGLVLNGISYLLIGGYTFHQGSFLQLTSDGNVYIMDRVVTDGRKISDSKESKIERKSQKVHELSRDVCSAVLVIVCSTIIVYCKENQSTIVRLIDPILSLVSIVILLGLSYPYSKLNLIIINHEPVLNFILCLVKEAASILLQTIPDTIDIEEFQKKIIEKFPEIQSIHDLHIWQLTQQKFVSTAHIIFLDPLVYKTIINDVLGFFHEQGINIVTIQPEFKNFERDESTDEEAKSLAEGVVKGSCLVACRQVDCVEKLCCKRKESDGSDDSTVSKSKGQLEQVISVRNISAEDLNALNNYTSAKSLNYSEPEDALQPDLMTKKRSSASLYNPSTVQHRQKYLKTMSTIDRNQDQVPASTSTSTSEGIHLISIKKFVSESVIKGSEHDDLGRENSEILVENRMLKQLDTTDNNEMEDLFEKCDKEK